MASVRERGSTRVLVSAIAGPVAAVVFVTGAIVASGYDEREVPRLESSVWVAREGQYARLNTELREIDTVRQVSNPSRVVQHGTSTLVFGQSSRQYWPVDAAMPADLVAEGDVTTAAGPAPRLAPIPAPSGTIQVQAAGDELLMLTERGTVYYGSVAATAAGEQSFGFIDPYADLAEATPEPGAPEEVEDAEPRFYVADAAAVNAAGLGAMYSSQPEELGVRTFDTLSGHVYGTVDVLVDAPSADEDLRMTMVGGRWVLLAVDTQRLWIDGVGGPIPVAVGADAQLQASSERRDEVVIADGDGLIRVDLATGATIERVAASGIPAQPMPVGDDVVAAWLTSTSGTMWTSSRGLVSLAIEPGALEADEEPRPQIHSNGARAVLDDMVSGMLWTVPDGTLIPTSAWTLDDSRSDTGGTTRVDDAAEQEPPVAMPDSFGVRAGSLARLPVLYNDHDPNRADVLSIVPQSVTALPEEFGVVSIAGNDQTAAVRVTATSGSATFSYAVTDGKAQSAPADVTLTVVPPTINTAPVWCGVEHCRQQWPTPQIGVDGTTVVDVLNGWVDPEGDPFVLAGVIKQDTSDPIEAIPTADGRVVIRQTDPNATGGEAVLTVVVVDAYGARAEKDLVVTIMPSPAFTLNPGVVVATANQLVRVPIGDYAVGGSGSYRLVDAIDASTAASGLTVEPNVADSTIDLRATQPGEYHVAFTVQDAASLIERTATLRFSVAARPGLTITPMTAFVRPGEDTLVDVLKAVQDPGGRVLVVTSAISSSPELAAAIVGQSQVRVRAATTDAAVGAVGTVAVTITDGAGAYVTGEIAVFLTQPERNARPIAIDDAATVRAGAQIDIPVLDNDIAPKGEQLALSPDVVGSGASGELAFANGTVLRYVAPRTPGTYTLSYATYLASAPSRLATADVVVTVVPASTNSPPRPRDLRARTIAGQRVEIDVPKYGVDPDGDLVTIVDVTQPGSGFGNAWVSANGTIFYRAPASGVPGGQVTFSYTMRDSQGAIGRGSVTIAVIPVEQADLTPVTFSDSVRVQVSSPTPVTVEPLRDDRDPAGGTLSLISLVPNAPGGPGDPAYDRLAALIHPSTDLAAGRVVLSAGHIVGVHSYIYAVESSATSSTAEGLIVVTVVQGEAADFPIVTDTVVTAANYLSLAGGIDVVTGKVQWATGDPSQLRLSLWGEAASAFRAVGPAIAGEYPVGGAVVPFQLEGEVGEETIVTYGFLRIPDFDDLRVQRRAVLPVVSVQEAESTSFDIRTMVDVADASTIEVGPSTSFIVQRSGAVCEPGSDWTIRYDAGIGAPWMDTCTVPVRLRGQQSWSMVSVPITVRPTTPQPILAPISRTVSPGATDTVQLYEQMTSWEGGYAGDRSSLSYTVEYLGSAFIVESQGEELIVTAKADAVPGTRESLLVRINGYDGVQSQIALTVGQAAQAVPVGATLSATCAATEIQCIIPLVGLPGEYDPYAGLPGGGLTVVGLADAGGCPSWVRVEQVSETAAAVVWEGGSKPQGGMCSVDFTVADAQGQTGIGVVELVLPGFPRPPVIRPFDWAKDGTGLSLLVEVDSVFPPVESVELLDTKASTITCMPSAVYAEAFVCEVGGLVMGDPHDFTAVAYNAVGGSDPSLVHRNYGYVPPHIVDFQVDSVYDRSITSAAVGAIDISLRLTELDRRATQRIEIVGGNQSRQLAIADLDFDELDIATVRVPWSGTGPVTFVATPYAERAAPPGYSDIVGAPGGSEGASLEYRAEVVGLPAMGTPTATFVGIGNSAGAITRVQIDLSGLDPKGTSARGIARIYGSAVDCAASPSRGAPVASAADQLTSATSATPIAEVDAVNGPVIVSGSFEDGRHYTFTVCASWGYGVASARTAEVEAYIPPAPPILTPRTYRLAVGSTSETSALGETVTWSATGIDQRPSASGAPSGFTIGYSTSPTPPYSWAQIELSGGGGQTWYAAFCLIADPSRCSDPSAAIEPEERMAGPVAIMYPANGTEQCSTVGPTVSPSSAIDVVQLTPSDPDEYRWRLNVRPEYAAIANLVVGSPSNAGASMYTCTWTPPEPTP